MKKFLLVFCGVFICFTIFGLSNDKTYAQTKKYATRGFYWGDSIKTIKKKEKAKFYISDKSTLVYKTKKFGYNAKLVYKFKNSKLSAVYILFDLPKDYYNWNELRIMHNKFKQKLKKELKTKSNGFTSQDEYINVSTMWQFYSRDVFLLSSNKNIKTSVTVAYLPH